MVEVEEINKQQTYTTSKLEACADDSCGAACRWRFGILSIYSGQSSLTTNSLTLFN